MLHASSSATPPPPKKKCLKMVSFGWNDGDLFPFWAIKWPKISRSKTQKMQISVVKTILRPYTTFRKKMVWLVTKQTNTWSGYIWHFVSIHFFNKMGHRRPLFCLPSSFQHTNNTIFTSKQREKMSIQYKVLGLETTNLQNMILLS